MQRLLPPVLVLLLGVAATALHITLDVSTISATLRWLGIPVGVAGLGISIWGSNRFAAVGTNIQTFDRPDVLVSDGLFRWSRNPMYLGFTLALIGLAIGLGSIVGVLAPGIFLLVANQWYIPFEEKQMRQTFHKQYEDYSQLVMRWLGRRTL